MANHQVQRNITIAADPSPIYDKIVDFHNWSSWSPWEDMDTNVTKSNDGAA